jgi:hypothetical protein
MKPGPFFLIVALVGTLAAGFSGEVPDSDTPDPTPAVSIDDSAAEPSSSRAA